jgi:Mg2+ and Co2+ transporter CorA
MQCSEFRVPQMKAEIEQEIEKLNNTLERIYQQRNTESINRLAMLSMILGGGAMITGYFGMNFGREFERMFFAGEQLTAMHYGAVIAVTLMVVGSILFAIFLVASNWNDYRRILLPVRSDKLESLRRTAGFGEVPEEEEQE